jgi:nicotinamidase-related amidase
MDRPTNPSSDPLDPYIEEAEARWDRVFAVWDTGPEHRLPATMRDLLSQGFSCRVLEDAIIDKCDKLIQDLAQRLYDEANSTKGYD